MAAGRPTKYDPNYHPKKAYAFTLLGATIKEMANFFDVEESTFYNWQKEYPEFLEAIKRGGAEADSKVSKSTYKLANGFYYTERRVEYRNDGLDEVVIETTKYMPPNVAAANIWLKNRRAKVDPKEGVRWADKQEFVVEGKVDIDFSQLSTDELLKRAEAIRKITNE